MFTGVKSVMVAIYHTHLFMGLMSFSLIVMQEDALHTNNFLNDASCWNKNIKNIVKNHPCASAMVDTMT